MSYRDNPFIADDDGFTSVPRTSLEAQLIRCCFMSVTIPLVIRGSRRIAGRTRKDAVILNLMVEFVLGHASAKKLTSQCGEYINHAKIWLTLLHVTV